MIKDVTVQVSEASYDVGQKLKNVVAAVKTALDDGFQIGQDLPVLVSAAVTDLVPAVQSALKVGAEMGAELEQATRGLMLGVHDIAFLFIKKPAA